MRTAQILQSASLAALLSLFATNSGARSIIRSPNPPRYGVEIEPHLLLGDAPGFGYNRGGYAPGFGARFSIPVMSPGFVKSINDSIAISFGPDFIHYSTYDYKCRGGLCDGGSAWVLVVPVTMQWNFWLTDKWSVFGEPGLVVRNNFSCDNAVYDCRGTRDYIDFSFYLGGRYHFSDTLALTLRLGYPQALSLGISIF